MSDSVADVSSDTSKAQDGSSPVEHMDDTPTLTLEETQTEVVRMLTNPSHEVYHTIDGNGVRKENLRALAEDREVYVAGALPQLRKPFVDHMLAFTFLMKMFTPLGLAISTILTDMTHWEVFASKNQDVKCYSRKGRSYFEYPIKRCTPSCFRALVEELISLRWICPMVGCMSGPFYTRDPSAPAGTSLSAAPGRISKEQALTDFADHWLMTHADRTKCQVLCCDTTDVETGCETVCGRSNCAFATETAAVKHWRTNKHHKKPYELSKGKSKLNEKFNTEQMAKQQAEIDIRTAKFRELQALRWGITLPVSGITYPEGYGTLTSLEALQKQREAENRKSTLLFRDLQSDSPTDVGTRAYGVPQLELVFRHRWFHGLLDPVLSPFTMGITHVLQWSQTLTDEEVDAGMVLYTGHLYDEQRPMTNDEFKIFPPEPRAKPKKTKASKGKRKHPSNDKVSAQPSEDDSAVDLQEQFGPTGVKRPKMEWGFGTGKRTQLENRAEDLRRTPAEIALVGIKNKKPCSLNKIYNNRLQTYCRLEGELLQFKRNQVTKSLREKILSQKVVTLTHNEWQIFTRFHELRVDRTVAFLRLQHATRCLHRGMIDMEWDRLREQEAGYNLNGMTQIVEHDLIFPLMDGDGYIAGTLANHLPIALHGDDLLRNCKKGRVVASADETQGVQEILAGRAWPKKHEAEARKAFEAGQEKASQYLEEKAETAGVTPQGYKPKMFSTPWGSKPKDPAGPRPAESKGKMLPDLSIVVPVAGGSSESSKAQGNKRLVKKTAASATVTSSETVKPEDLAEFPEPPADCKPKFKTQLPKGAARKGKMGKIVEWTGPTRPPVDIPAFEPVRPELSQEEKIEKAIFLFKGNVSTGPPEEPEGDEGRFKLRQATRAELERERELNQRVSVPTATAALQADPSSGLRREQLLEFESNFSQVSDEMAKTREGRRSFAGYTAGLWWDAEVTSAAVRGEAPPQTVTFPRIHRDLPALVIETEEVNQQRTDLLRQHIQYGDDLRQLGEQTLSENSQLTDENSKLKIEVTQLKSHAR